MDGGGFATPGRVGPVPDEIDGGGSFTCHLSSKNLTDDSKILARWAAVRLHEPRCVFDVAIPRPPFISVFAAKLRKGLQI
jgi:hypothetical protein